MKLRFMAEASAPEEVFLVDQLNASFKEGGIDELCVQGIHHTDGTLGLHITMSVEMEYKEHYVQAFLELDELSEP